MPEQVDVLKFQCDCGAKLKAPAAAIGRRIRCPKCKRAFVATDPDAPAQVVEPQPVPKPKVRSAPRSSTPQKPASKPRTKRPKSVKPATDKPKPAPAKKPDLEPAPLGDDDWLSDLAASEHQAESTGETVVVTEKQENCANCAKPLPTGAKKCPLCGHSKAAPKKKKSEKAKDAAGTAGKVALKTGRFFIGCALSLVGALIGAAIWMGIAAIFRVEIGYVAIALGAMAGFGMVIGYGDQNLRAGLVASAMSLVGIIIGKIGLVFVLAAAMIFGELDIEYQRESVASYMTEEAFEARGIFSEDQQFDQWDDVYAEMETQINAMSDDEITEKWEAYQEEDYELEYSRDRLARFRTDREGDRQKLALYDEAREDIYNTEFAKINDWSQGDLEQQLKEVDVWESSGQWNDDAYLLVLLADQRADEAAKNDSSIQGLEGEPKWREKWNAHYQTALASAEQLTPTARSDEISKLRQDDEREMKEAMKEFEDTIAENGGGLGAIGWSAAFFALFGPFDILWTLFAVGSAFKIAGGTD